MGLGVSINGQARMITGWIEVLGFSKRKNEIATTLSLSSTASISDLSSLWEVFE
jgi:hypothetical protein